MASDLVGQGFDEFLELAARSRTPAVAEMVFVCGAAASRQLHLRHHGRAQADLRGHSDGTIEMAREGGVWKLIAEKWKQ